MHQLPDGSGFFVATIGAREPGFVNWLKYHKRGSARRWLFVYRMYRFATYEMRPRMGRWKGLLCALRCP